MALKDSLNPCILQDTFHSYPSLSPCVLCLTERVLKVRYINKSKAEQDDILLADIVGCHLASKRNQRAKSDNPESDAYFCIYTYPLKSSGGILSKHVRRERVTVTFVMRKFDTYERNAAVIRRWRCSILWLLRGKQLFENGEVQIPSSLPCPLKLLILVNPHSGPGKAYHIFKERVVPMLTESDTHYELLVTDKANCARNFVKKCDLLKWNGIVVVSGDGLLFEVFNGLMERPDWQSAIKMPIGVIPGGSGNGLARAICHATGEPYDTTAVISSILNIIRGRVAPMDLVQVQTTDEPVYSFLSIGWGLLADIDIESERLRIIGEARFSVWAVIRALGLRTYKGKLSYLPVAGHVATGLVKSCVEPKVKRSKTLDGRLEWSCIDDDKSANDSSIFRSKSFGVVPSEFSLNDSKKVKLLKFSYSEEFTKSDEYNLTVYNDSLKSTLNAEVLYDDEYNALRNDCETKSLINNTGGKNGSEESFTTEDNTSFLNFPPTLPPLNEPVPEDWTVIDGEFVLVYVCHQSHLSSDVLCAPEAKLDDGIMWLIVIRSGVSRAQVINFLSSLQTGHHVNIPYVHVIPIHAFRLEPSQNDGFLTVDGEVINCGAIQAKVLPSVARIMTR